MIQVPNSGPKTVAFEQKQVSKLEAGIANEQISKAARAEVDALSAVDNASFRLVKATEQMKAAEIAYHEAVAKGASNREQLRAIYNNEVAGYREADKAAEIAAEGLALAKAATLGLRELAKREFSTEERKALAEKGAAMPDGSYPIKTVADLKNAISSYGRAKNADAVKAHIISRAKDLSATDQLPEAWSETTTKSITKDVSMEQESPQALVVLCPGCMGHDDFECPNCHGTHLVTVGNLIDKLGGEEDQELNKSFDTASLLTRDFQKSAGYQNYIFTKGGPGSGAQPGHPFNGNQWTGGMKTFADGRREGWKTTLHRYSKNIEVHEANAKAAQAAHHEATVRGDHAAAQAHARLAASHYEKAASAHRGMHEILKAKADHPAVKQGFHESNRGNTARALPKGMSADKILGEKGHYNAQTGLRGQKQAMNDQAEMSGRLASNG